MLLFPLRCCIADLYSSFSLKIFVVVVFLLSNFWLAVFFKNGAKSMCSTQHYIKIFPRTHWNVRITTYKLNLFNSNFNLQYILQWFEEYCHILCRCPVFFRFFRYCCWFSSILLLLSIEQNIFLTFYRHLENNVHYICRQCFEYKTEKCFTKTKIYMKKKNSPIFHIHIIYFLKEQMEIWLKLPGRSKKWRKKWETWTFSIVITVLFFFIKSLDTIVELTSVEFSSSSIFL